VLRKECFILVGMLRISYLWIIMNKEKSKIDIDKEVLNL